MTGDQDLEGFTERVIVNKNKMQLGALEAWQEARQEHSGQHAPSGRLPTAAGDNLSLDTQPRTVSANLSRASAEAASLSIGGTAYDSHNELQSPGPSADGTEHDMDLPAEADQAGTAFSVAQGLSKLLNASSDAQLLLQLLPDANPARFLETGSAAYRQLALQQVSRANLGHLVCSQLL